MIGTIYDRLAAITAAMVEEGIDPREISIHAHPETMREFAILFDTPERRAEITFDGMHTFGGLELTENEHRAIVGDGDVARPAGMSPMRWRGVRIFDDRYLGKGGFCVKAYNQRAVLVKTDALPQLDPYIPRDLDASEVTAKTKRALERITPRASTETDIANIRREGKHDGQ